jgi:glyoxylase-like metal-dependent hydrolase (beta-lactamase superfamily II)
MKTTDRRSILKAGLHGFAGLATLPMLGSLAGCASQQLSQKPLVSKPLPASKLAVATLNDRLTVISGAPGNVIVLNANDGVMLVDSGSFELAPSVQLTLDGAPVHTVFNTHYHRDQTGGNALFGAAGATIHAHKITWQWVRTDYYVPATDSWVKALPPAAHPAQTFRNTGNITVGAENISYGYLLEAHTRGDAYVLFRDSNVLAVGDVVSPLRDPALDWYAGGWIGGRVDAMDDLLALANEETLIVPAYGKVMTRAELQAERDMMKHLYDRCTTLTTQGHGAQDMLNVGVMNEIDRKFEDPYQFLYDVAKGNWAHYTNFGGKTV